MEFACKIAGAKIIVILGHTQCGAVKGACDHVEMGNLTVLLSKIQPAVSSEKSVTEDRTSSSTEFVEKVTAINVENSVQGVMDRSPILKELIRRGDCGIVGGNHEISTGKVTFYPHTMFGFFKPVAPTDDIPESQNILGNRLTAVLVDNTENSVIESDLNSLNVATERKGRSHSHYSGKNESQDSSCACIVQ